MPSNFVLAYYGSLIIRGSVEQESGVPTIHFAEEIFLAGTIFIVITKDGASPCYYI